MTKTRKTDKKKRPKLVGEISELRPARAKGTLSRERRNGGVVIIKLDCNDRFFELESVAAEFWQMLDGKKTVEMIYSRLLEKHRAPKEKVVKEAKRLVRDLYKHSLIEC